MKDRRPSKSRKFQHGQHAMSCGVERSFRDRVPEEPQQRPGLPDEHRPPENQPSQIVSKMGQHVNNDSAETRHAWLFRKNSSCTPLERLAFQTLMPLLRERQRPEGTTSSRWRASTSHSSDAETERCWCSRTCWSMLQDQSRQP